MTPSNNSYCKIFVSDVELPALMDEIAALLERQFVNRVISIDTVLLEVRPNPDHDHPLLPTDDFVGWPVIVELESESPTIGQTMITTVARVLNALWAAGHRAVAACDFEEELPWAGGIRRPGQARIS